MRTIGAWSHGIIDYVIFILFIIGPSVAGFAGRQAIFAYVLGAAFFLLTILTRFPLGVVKVLRFPLHGAIEIVLALLLLVLPWIANFSRGVHSRNFYVAMAILMLIVWAMTDFRGARNRT
jgi:hypothetical protein